MSSDSTTSFQGIEGAERPSQAAMEDTSASEVSDRATACVAADPKEDTADATSTKAGPKGQRRGSPHLDTRYDAATLDAVRTRSKRLGLDASSWVRAVVRDALDQRRTDELDAALAVALLVQESHVEASATARHLGALIRPLAINVNDLDRRARAGEAVTLSAEVPELVELLREVRELLGDRLAS
ncbi:hypothetical protein ACNPM8_13160 [Glutamicibacter sp. AGC46]